MKKLVSAWRGRLPDRKILYEYMPFCRSLLYEDEELVRDVTSLLRDNATLWATQKSPIYKRFGRVIQKSDLDDRDSWLVPEIKAEGQPMATSGSTTGQPFSYMRWEPFLYPIECENHYDLIMDEFDMPKNPEIMYFFDSGMYDPERLVTVRNDSPNFMEHHGLRRKANVHYVNFSMMRNNSQSFFKSLVTHYLPNVKLDLVFGPGPTLNSLCSHLKGSGVGRLCRLVSNSNERMLKSDAQFLVLSGLADHVCDHMRCWDGGATFFTCVHGTYHLLDNLSWCEEEAGRLVSTDYFNLVSPFVNYWNGDYCSIGSSYERCGCGRLYRNFSFLENRPFSLKGVVMSEIKEKISSLGIKGIKQVRCGLDMIEILSLEKISEADQNSIRDITDKFKFKFAVEK